MAGKVTKSSPLLALCLESAVRALGAMPLTVARGFGSFIATLLWRFPNQFRENSQRNVERCFPELSTAEQRRIVRRSLRSTAWTIAEAGAVFHWRVERLRDLVEDDRGLALMDAGIAAGKGVIALGPHVGNWELLSHAVTLHHPMVCLYRPPRVAELDAYLRRSRERLGSTMVPVSATGIRRLARTLLAGGVVGILPDQEPLKRHGVFAPFFGIEALTMTLVGQLARRYGSKVVYGVAVRTESGRFRVLLEPAPEGLYDADPVRAATALNAGVEKIVRAHPEQYTWSYRRFRTRPPAELAARRT